MTDVARIRELTTYQWTLTIISSTLNWSLITFVFTMHSKLLTFLSSIKMFDRLLNVKYWKTNKGKSKWITKHFNLKFSQNTWMLTLVRNARWQSKIFIMCVDYFFNYPPIAICWVLTFKRKRCGGKELAINIFDLNLWFLSQQNKMSFELRRQRENL